MKRLTRQKRRILQKQRKLKLNIACWNVRSLVENEGSLETARVRQNERAMKGNVEKKIVLLIWELKRYNIFATAISETKWFNNNIYEIEDHVVLHSGRGLPAEGEQVIRQEGVGIILNPDAAKAWREGGEQWEPVSSRIVTARLKLNCGRGHFQYLFLISVYAPTFRTPQHVKDDFFAEVQMVIDRVPENDILVILGDWNARVGSQQGNHCWQGVLGKHGLGSANEAGLSLLSFCSTNSLAIMNTFYEKKSIHKQTWQHPGTKNWHCIDYVIMRQSQRRRCVDTQVMRGAECWSDHRMVRARILVTSRSRGRGKKPKKGAKYLNHNVLRTDDVRSAFDSQLSDMLDQRWSSTLPAKDKLTILVECTKEVAQKCLPAECKRNADWFKDNEHLIKPALEKRNNLLRIWMSSKSEADRVSFARQKCAVQRLMRYVKNKWFKAKAAEIELKMIRSKSAWKDIKQLQLARRGLRPVPPRALKKEDGTPCESAEECKERWKQHFQKVLNVISPFDSSAVDRVRQRVLHVELDHPPNEEELEEALSALKSNKAGGKNELTPELVKYVGTVFGEYVLDLFKTVWEEESIPKEWVDAVLVAIPKKGDLSVCDNWRGISLLDVFGKLLARILKQRLEVVAERELTESQCGFRKGRGCVDMIFCARQLIEKTLEHEETVYIVFVDLKKAYDSVPREAMWKALEKYGYPSRMISLIRSFHDKMSAELKINGEILEGEIKVTNGLRQGCTMAPTLFNLFFNLVMETWRSQCEEDGVSILFNADGHLVGSRSKKFNTTKWGDLEFADDTAIVSASKEKMSHAMDTLFTVTKQWGLTVSAPKTKAMVVSRTDSMLPELQFSSASVEMVSEFKYLGSVLHRNGLANTDVNLRIDKASQAFGRLKKSVFQDKALSITTKRVVYRAVVLGTLLYESETWTTKRAITQKLETFHNRCLRGIFGISRIKQRDERISSSEIRERFGMKELIQEVVMLRRLRWLGHVARMSNSRMPKQALFGRLTRARPFHGVKMRWKDRVRKDMAQLDVPSRWFGLVQDRNKWYKLCQEGLEKRVERRLEEEQRKRQEKRLRQQQPQLGFTCEHCQRSFRRPGDLKQHKCRTEKQLQESSTLLTTSNVEAGFICQQCQRWFRRSGDLKRHKCDSVRSKRLRNT